MRCAVMSSVQIFLRTQTSHSPSTCLIEDPEGNFLSSLQAEKKLHSLGKQEHLGDCAYFVNGSPKVFT